jgi:carotenoid cleavage dioxygenase-like enzyme
MDDQRLREIARVQMRALTPAELSRLLLDLAQGKVRSIAVLKDASDEEGHIDVPTMMDIVYAELARRQAKSADHVGRGT